MLWSHCLYRERGERRASAEVDPAEQLLSRGSDRDHWKLVAVRREEWRYGCPVGGALAATLAGSMLDRASRAIRHCSASKRGEATFIYSYDTARQFAYFTPSSPSPPPPPTRRHPPPSRVRAARLRQCGAAIDPRRVVLETTKITSQKAQYRHTDREPTTTLATASYGYALD